MGPERGERLGLTGDRSGCAQSWRAGLRDAVQSP